MGYEVVYEISKFPILEIIFSSAALFGVIFVSGLVVCLKSQVKKLKGKKSTKGDVLSLFMCFAAVIVFSLVFGTMIFDGVEGELKNPAMAASEEYYNGQYSVIEGYAEEVTDGVNGGLYVFTIEDEEFDFSRWFGAYKRQLNGCYLKVYYLDAFQGDEDNNRIVKIEKRT